MLKAIARQTTAILAACATAALVLGNGPAYSAEVKLKAVTAFPKSHQLSRSFLKFIDFVNKEAAGTIKIDYIGGPEVAPPRKQPVALRNGLFDILFGPPAYYQGLFPEVGAFQGVKKPAEARELGGYELMDAAMREKLGATFLGRFNYGNGLYLFLKDEPKRTAAGGLDLSGLKLRASPSYVEFFKSMGATPVVMRGPQIYTALERGVIDGAGYDPSGVFQSGAHKFLKYRIEPNYGIGVVVAIANAKKFDAMPKEARDKLTDLAKRWEKMSMDQVLKDDEEVKAKLAEVGQKAITLSDKAAADYVDGYMEFEWKRVRANDKVKIDLDKAYKAFR